MKTYQTSRYEFKYLITENQARAIQALVRARLRPDTYTREGTIGYHVRSLYFDSRDLSCYNQTACGEKNRFKLRMRFYDDTQTGPVFLEIKRRVTNVIQKKRACVSHAAADKIVRGAAADYSMLLNDSASERDGLEEFCQLRDRLAAVGTVYVDYYRQAYQTENSNQFRVTFDREVCGRRYEPGSALQLPERREMSKIEGVVLEMKFINQPAPWMNAIANQFNLQPTSVPKYVECIDVVQPAMIAMLAKGQF